MKDLYKQLGVRDTADESDVRAAIDAALPSATREAAGFILLDPQRREVYDRNRRALATVGQLRANLGLNLTRFWPRARFEDFTIDLSPPPPRRPRYRVDAAAMAWAFGVKPPGAARESKHDLRYFFVACGLALLGAAAVGVAWWVRRAG